LITYVDTSALIKLVIEEEGSDRVELVWGAADALASASLVVVEARAALAAATRAGRLTRPQHREAKAALADVLPDLHLVSVTDDLIRRASDLAEDDALRGYDAVHLAAALRVDASVVASADDALCQAAMRRGLHVANPLAG
jgi:predicted nucleic acid-binding protein